MNIGGLLTRSFGTGTTAFNQGERDALTRMRDRQAFVDEEEARRRRAVAEQAAYADSLGPETPFAGVQGALSGVPGAMTSMAFKMGTPPPAATGVGVAASAPAAAPTAPAGVAPAAAPTAGVTAPVAPLQIKGRTAGKPKSTAEQYYDKEILSTLNVLADHMAKKPLRIATKSEVPGAGPSIEYKTWDTKRQQLEDRVKSLEAGRISAAPTPVTRDTTVRTGEQFKELARVNSQTPAARVSAATQRAFATTSEEAIKNVLGREGGYANNPADRGGETKYGISKRSYPNLDIANLTKEEAAAIYKRDYWDGMNIDQLPPEMREVVFDAAVNQGKGFASKALQQSGMDPAKFLALREQRYRDIVARDPSQAQFTGWFNRVNEFKGVTTQLGATPSAASNAYVPPVEQAKPADYRNAVPVVDAEYNQTLALRQAAYQRAVLARDEQVPELYAQSVAELRQLDMKLVHLQGMVGLGDIVDDPMATQRLSQVISHYRGKEPGYYILQPRPDGKYNEIVNGRLSQQGITLQEVIDKTRMMFDQSYAAAVNATRAAQSEAAIKTFSELQILAAKSGFTINEKLADRQAEAYIETLKGNNAYRQAVEVARINNQGKTVDPKFFNTAEGVTLMSVGNQLFKVLLQEDGKGGQVPGSEYLAPVTGGLMPTQ